MTGVVGFLATGYLVCVMFVMAWLVIRPHRARTQDLILGAIVIGASFLIGLGLYSATLIVIGIEGA